jgi:hypothetical protein
MQGYVQEVVGTLVLQKRHLEVNSLYALSFYQMVTFFAHG